MQVTSSTLYDSKSFLGHSKVIGSNNYYDGKIIRAYEISQDKTQIHMLLKKKCLKLVYLNINWEFGIGKMKFILF